MDKKTAIVEELSEKHTSIHHLRRLKNENFLIFNHEELKLYNSKTKVMRSQNFSHKLIDALKYEDLLYVLDEEG